MIDNDIERHRLETFNGNSAWFPWPAGSRYCVVHSLAHQPQRIYASFVGGEAELSNKLREFYDREPKSFSRRVYFRPTNSVPKEVPVFTTLN